MKLRRLAAVSCIAVQTIMQTADCRAECCLLLTSSRAMPRAVWIIPLYLTGAWPP